VVGGFTADGDASARADLYSPSLDRWRRLPDLPVGVHHAMAVGTGGRLYVLGGYVARGMPLRTAFVLEGGRWRALPRMPFPRAAAGAAVVGARIVVAGGVGADGRLARNARPDRIASRLETPRGLRRLARGNPCGDRARDPRLLLRGRRRGDLSLCRGRKGHRPDLPSRSSREAPSRPGGREPRAARGFWSTNRARLRQRSLHFLRERGLLLLPEGGERRRPDFRSHRSRVDFA